MNISIMARCAYFNVLFFDMLMLNVTIRNYGGAGI